MKWCNNLPLEGKKTHLYEFHREHGKMSSFAEFEMPMWYKGIIPEHMSVRKSVGIFDVSHMGRVMISGRDALPFLNYVTTNDVSKLEDFDAQYSVICNKKGGTMDDFVLSRQQSDRYFMVYNAANRTKNYGWLTKQAGRFDLKLEEVSDNIAMFAIQGPKALETLQNVTDEDLGGIQRFKCSWVKISGQKAFVSRTGYTGEDGFEVFIWDTPVEKPAKATRAWEAILEAGSRFNIEPCGLGARDTLRLEAGMCLYGNDLSEDITPLEARLGFVVKLAKEDFIGRDFLSRQKAEGIAKRRVGLRMLEGGIPRPNHEVFRNGEKIGHVTSGTFSPLLKQGIAMAYLKTKEASLDGTVNIKIRNKEIPATIVRFPFYDTTKYGYSRDANS